MQSVAMNIEPNIPPAPVPALKPVRVLVGTPKGVTTITIRNGSDLGFEEVCEKAVTAAFRDYRDLSPKNPLFETIQDLMAVAELSFPDLDP